MERVCTWIAAPSTRRLRSLLAPPAPICDLERECDSNGVASPAFPRHWGGERTCTAILQFLHPGGRPEAWAFLTPAVISTTKWVWLDGSSFQRLTPSREP